MKTAKTNKALAGLKNTAKNKKVTVASSKRTRIPTPEKFNGCTNTLDVLNILNPVENFDKKAFQNYLKTGDAGTLKLRGAYMFASLLGFFSKHEVEHMTPKGFLQTFVKSGKAEGHNRAPHSVCRLATEKTRLEFVEVTLTKELKEALIEEYNLPIERHKPDTVIVLPVPNELQTEGKEDRKSIQSRE
jgi:hypothetical protein